MMEDLLSTQVPAENDSGMTSASDVNFNAESTHSFSQSTTTINKNTNTSDNNSQIKNSDQHQLKGSMIFSDAGSIKKAGQLLNNYNRWRHFLLTWKRLELLKIDWGRRKLGVENISNPEIFSRFW